MVRERQRRGTGHVLEVFCFSRGPAGTGRLAGDVHLGPKVGGHLESGERGVCLWAGGARGQSRDRVDAGIASDRRRCGPWAISSFGAVPHQKRAVRTVFYTPNTHRPRLPLRPVLSFRFSPVDDCAAATSGLRWRLRSPPCLPVLHVLAMHGWPLDAA